MICLLTGCNVFAQLQNNGRDSLQNCNSYQYRIQDDSHRLKLKEVLIPCAITGISTIYVNSTSLNEQKYNIQNVLSAEGEHKLKIDDYLQYTPILVTYGLDLIGLKGKHSFKDKTIILAMSYTTMGILVNTMKYSFKEKRPDSNARNSFPSGHTATAFMGAEFLYKEYQDSSSYIKYTGYAMATVTGYLRIYNNRHYFNDVIAGACIGILSTKFAYWLYPKCFKHTARKYAPVISGSPFYSPQEAGINLHITV